MKSAGKNLQVLRLTTTLAGLAGILVLVAGISLSVGTSGVSLGELWRLIIGEEGENSDIAYQIIVLIRLPRILLAVIVGAGFSVAGATLQALLRNPLAEPYVLGISSGGTVGAVLAIVSGIGLAQLTTPLFSFCGSLTVMLLVLALGERRCLQLHPPLYSGPRVSC